MPGIDLTIATQQLTEALTELSKARKAQSYTVGNRSKENQRVRDANADVTKWNNLVSNLSRGGPQIRGITAR